MRRRIGGNAQCPCKSGFKFKNCCGRTPPPRFDAGSRPDASDREGVELVEALRRSQPQPGRLPTSVIHQGKRIRLLGHRVYFWRLDQTFNEFLLELIQNTLGKPWYMGQIGLPADRQHHIIRWFKSSADRSRVVVGDDRFREGSIWSAPPTGDDLSLATLGYDLMHLLHVNALPRDLVDRLSSRRHFQGARYEIATGATFVRAGLEVKFIQGHGVKHPEFIAHDLGSGVGIAVEAKSRHRAGHLHEPGSVDEPRALRGDVDGLVNEALGQAPGDCPFMVFIDVNVPPVPGVPVFERAWFQDIWSSMQALGEPTEQNPEDFNGLFFTSFPFHWEGPNPATLAQTLYVLPKITRHKVPLDVMGRLIRAVNDYGRVPPEL